MNSLLELAKRLERIALARADHMFPSVITWDREAVADVANALTAAACLRALAEQANRDEGEKK